MNLSHEALLLVMGQINAVCSINAGQTNELEEKLLRVELFLKEIHQR